MEKYDKGEEVGRGAYGVVYNGTIKATAQPVALKKMMIGNRKGDEDDGISFTALREIKYMQDHPHENIVPLIDVFAEGENMYLVFELMQTDLEKVIQASREGHLFLSKNDIRTYMRMFVRGVAHLHRCGVLHRDLKPGNLLIGFDGQLKIGDFGLARRYGSPNAKLTSTAVTIWYRAPELLFGAEKYGYAVDIWSVGCIFAEMLLGTPYFPGKGELHMIQLLTAALGSPTEKDWPEMEQMPLYVKVAQTPRPDPAQLFRGADAMELDFLSRLLVWNPNKRPTAADLLQHRYLNPVEPGEDEATYFTDPADLPRPDPNHSKKPQAALNTRSRLENLGDDGGQAKRRLDFFGGSD